MVTLGKAHSGISPSGCGRQMAGNYGRDRKVGGSSPTRVCIRLIAPSSLSRNRRMKFKKSPLVCENIVVAVLHTFCFRLEFYNFFRSYYLQVFTLGIQYTVR